MARRLRPHLAALFGIGTTLVIALLLTPAARATTRTIPRPSGCTNPAAPVPTGPGNGLKPNQLAAAYNVSSLWTAGYQGQGESVALLENGASLDSTRFDAFSSCFAPMPRLGPTPAPMQDVVTGSGPVPGGEGIFDPTVVTSIAPAAQIYMFESGPAKVQNVLPQLLAAALDPANTGGHLVDVVSTSFSGCEATWTATNIQKMQSVLRRAASLGVPVIADAGDDGSAGSYTSSGKPVCVKWPADIATDRSLPGLSLGVQYPASSPLATGVGGTELQINGTIPTAGDPAGGTITGEVVWNQVSSSSSGDYFAGTGGHSDLFTVADAPWERDVGLSGFEHVPVISALAGSPKYPQGGIGTSGAAPLMAGAIAVLDGYLTTHGAAQTGPLNPTLFHIAADPALYRQVFNDVTSGTNDLLGLGCCTAGPGYDEASGLGSLNVAAFGDALIADPSLRVAWTTLKLSAYPQNSTGVPEVIRGVTNNVLAGTPYFLYIYDKKKLIAQCKRSPCLRSLSPEDPLTPHTYTLTADVGPVHAKPFGRAALVSQRLKVTIHFTPPHCHGSTCM